VEWYQAFPEFNLHLVSFLMQFRFVTVFPKNLNSACQNCVMNLIMATLLYICGKYPSSDSSVGIALGYGLDDRDSRVRFPAGAGNFSLHRCVQNGSGTHPASYPMGTRGPSPRSKAAEA
jgi:hypothetical protein